MKINIAMTGDGVNDAPSLVASHLGIAMAKDGTDVARGAADILLLDDNLESLIMAIEEGRTMYKRLRSVLRYVITSNFGEMVTIGTAIFLGLPPPLIAVQIIWLNLVTDGFLDIGLALEPKHSSREATTPHARTTKTLLNSADVLSIMFGGALMAAGTLYIYMHHAGESVETRRTAALLAMATFQWIHAWALRTERRSVFSVPITANPYLIAATVIVFVLTVSALYIPFLQSFLGTTALGFSCWVEAGAFGFLVLLFEEIRKIYRRSK